MKSHRRILQMVGCSMFFVFAWPGYASACQPVPPLLFVSFFNTTIWGGYAGGLVMKSALSLLILSGVIFFKCFLFAHKEKGRLKAGHAYLFMFAANLYSTVVGLLATVLFAVVPSISLLLAPIVFYFLFKTPARELSSLLNRDVENIDSSVGITIALALGTVASAAFLFMSQGYLYSSHLNYWFLKIVYTTLGVSVGLAVSIGYEAAVIQRTMRKSELGDWNCYRSVAWANVWSIFISVGIAAAAMLPSRFESSNFLVHVFRIIRHLAA